VLLFQIGFVTHAGMQVYLARQIDGVGSELDPDPAMSVVRALEGFDFNSRLDFP
jgi:hypothetical protein